MLQYLLSIIKSFSQKEFALFLLGSAIALLSGILLIIQLINIYTVAQPADGGIFIEGSVGQIAYINPVLARDGSVDKDMVSLLFASVFDLAESITHDDSFKTWNIRIKEDAKWHDGSFITSDDIIFTIQTIQNPDTLSPLFGNWQNITVKRVSEREFIIETINSYSLFENLIKDLRPIPKKYFADISPSNIRLSAYNLKPTGSGPFMFDKLEKQDDGFITGIFLKRNDYYSAINSLPHLDGFTELYFKNEESLLRSFNKGKIDGFGTFTPNISDFIEINATEKLIPTSRYYAIFLNQNANSVLMSQNVRRALSLFINKNTIIKDVFNGKAVPQTGPLPSYWNSTGNVMQEPSGDKQQGKDLLISDGWIFNETTNTWNKQFNKSITQLSFTLKILDSDIMNSMSESIKKQLKESGVDLKIEVVDPNIFSDAVLKTRNYEMMIFGNVLLSEPDLTSFWHSNERFYPGLNFSLFENKGIDSLLSKSKSLEIGSSGREQVLSLISDTIVSECPAIFLVSPSYSYLTRSSSVGISVENISTPETRFVKIIDWYAKIKRTSRY